jgi:hypothetical protein
MKKNVISGFICCWALFFGVAAQESKETPDELAKIAFENGKNGGLLVEYGFTRKQTRQERDKDRVKENVTVSETFLPPFKSKNNRFIEIVVSRNGVPAPPAEIEKERLKAGQRLEKAEQEAAKNPLPVNPADKPAGLSVYLAITNTRAAFSPAAILQSCAFAFAGNENIAGRAAVKLSFRARADKPFYSKYAYLNQIAGYAWIDAKDKVLAQMEGWHVSQFNGATPPDSGQAVVRYASVLLPDGYWMPQLIRINGLVNPKFAGGQNDDWAMEFSHYRRFVTEAKDYTVTPAVKP